MKKVFAILILVFSLGIASVFYVTNRPADLLFRKSEEEPRQYSLEEIELFHSKVQAVDPKDDVRKRYRLFDRSFVGVMGFTMMIPGVEGYDQRLIDRYGYKEILGGTDFIQTKEQEAHNNAIWSYAIQYNQELLRLLKARR